jgi:hypothetical protein
MNLMELVEKVGKDIAASQMFGCKNESQGRVIALSCITTGRDILSVPEEYHLMNNKLSLQAIAMLGRLSKAGGEFEVISHSPDCCHIAVRFKGRHFDECLTWEEAKQEPFVYRGSDKEIIPKLLAGKAGELELSSNYATPRRRMQHLWARVVSDAVRVVAPELVSGTYTPEEVADFSGLVTPELGSSAVQEVAFPRPASESAPLRGQAMEQVNFATVTQFDEISSLVDRLEIPQDKIDAALAKRGVKHFEELTCEQADEMLAGLRERAAKLVESQQVESGSTSLKVNGPISQELERKIKDKIAEIAQESTDGSKLAGQVREKFLSSGMKMAEMRYADAEQLLFELESRQLDAFFARSLVRAASGE